MHFCTIYFSFALAGHRGTCLRPLHIFALLALLSPIGCTRTVHTEKTKLQMMNMPGVAAPGKHTRPDHICINSSAHRAFPLPRATQPLPSAYQNHDRNRILIGRRRTSPEHDVLTTSSRRRISCRGGQGPPRPGLPGASSATARVAAR